MNKSENNIESSLKIKNYKCFGDTAQGFDEIKPINIIIGKNNSGKSSLIDLIKFASDEKISIADLNKSRNQLPSIEITSNIKQAEIAQVFRKGTRGGGIPQDHNRFGQQFLDKSICVELTGENFSTSNFLGISNVNSGVITKHKKKFKDLARQFNSPLETHTFKKIASERDILPEQDQIEVLKLQPDGKYATNIIQNFLNLATLDTDYVRNNFLDAINGIFNPDIKFIGIRCQKIAENKWEIFLEEENKGVIQLSESGSGLKTIILCLIQVILTPVVEKKKLSKYVFAFEELENNLHPSLLRSLLLYLRNTAIKNGAIFFLTTHSNVVIDLFSKDDKAQILHVTQDNDGISQVNSVSSYYDNVKILDDLDVRASDLLQSNMVIWVEGPSDRIYLNKWIELYSNGSLQEGAHYQIVFYGGRLLSHLSFSNPEDAEIENLIKLLTVNRNAYIVIDSDKRYRADKINDTKKRIRKEMLDHSRGVWITKGKEIENYLPVSVINKALPTNFRKQIEKYDLFNKYLNKRDKGLGDKFSRNKVQYAHLFSDKFEREDFEGVLDLESQIKEIISFIKKANSNG